MYEVDGKLENTCIAAVSGSRLSKFSIDVAKKLFTQEELAESTVCWASANPQMLGEFLSPKRTEVMKGKYGDMTYTKYICWSFLTGAQSYSNLIIWDYLQFHLKIGLGRLHDLRLSYGAS